LTGPVWGPNISCDFVFQCVSHASNNAATTPDRPLQPRCHLCRTDHERHYNVAVPVVPLRARRGHQVPVLDRRLEGRRQRVIPFALQVPEPTPGVPPRHAGAAAPVGGLRRHPRAVQRSDRLAVRPRRVLAVQHLPARRPQPVAPSGVAARAHGQGRQPHLLHPLQLHRHPHPPRRVPRGRRPPPLLRVPRRGRSHAVRVREPMPGRHRHAGAAEVPARGRRRRPARPHRAGAQHGVRAAVETGGGRGVRPVRASRRVMWPASGGSARDVGLRVFPDCCNLCMDCFEIRCAR
jgi:hypothetical protein